MTLLISMLPHGLLAYFSCVLQGSMTSLATALVPPWLYISDLQEKLIYQHILCAGNLRLVFGVEGQGDLSGTAPVCQTQTGDPLGMSTLS